MFFFFFFPAPVYIIRGIFLSSELGRKSLTQRRRGRKCNPGRKHRQGLITTWKKQAKRAGPDCCNTASERLSLGPQNVLVLVCLFFQGLTKKATAAVLNE